MNKHLFNEEATNVYLKTLKVIDGCKDIEQLTSAMKYSDLFKLKYANSMDIDVFSRVIDTHIETKEFEVTW